jgi:hypothetical protein
VHPSNEPFSLYSPSCLEEEFSEVQRSKRIRLLASKYLVRDHATSIGVKTRRFSTMRCATM